jgi:hypothetical protein
MTWKRRDSTDTFTWLGYTAGGGGKYVKVRWTHRAVGEASDLEFDDCHYELLTDDEGIIAEEHASLPPHSDGHDTVCLDILGLQVIEGVDLDQASQNAATKQAARRDEQRKTKKEGRDMCPTALKAGTGM